ncbi:MAG: helix-turn-helix transcriptional regulator [Candidatus Sulfotelmatobacter sp.]|jgi:transcriptional regulator with XRE-family HTH domain
MSEIYRIVGEKIRDLRTHHRGKGISQEQLARELKTLGVNTTANTISRWETAMYKPSVEDLEKLARFFGVPISVFFPQIEPSEQVRALLSATGNLGKDDLEELTRYALFRKARGEVRKARRK